MQLGGDIGLNRDKMAFSEVKVQKQYQPTPSGGQSEAVDDMRVGGQDTGQQKKARKQFLLVLERDSQQPWLKGDTIRKFNRQWRIRQNNLDAAGVGFGLEPYDVTDDSLMTVHLRDCRRIGYSLVEPSHQLTLLNGEFPADANGTDPVHEVNGLTFLQSKEHFNIATAEKGNGFGRAGFGKDRRKLMDIRRVIRH